ncbi:hypothetical protein SCUP515_07651 [Seiridium cupressi]
MNRLPAEILHMICIQLEPSDTRAVRFCGRQCADVGAWYGFPNIHFYLCKRDLQMLREMSEHRIIAERLKSLVYIVYALDTPAKTLEAYLECTRLPAYRSQVGRAQDNYLSEELSLRIRDDLRKFDKNVLFEPLPVEGVQENYNRYRIAVEEQQEILTRREDYAVLREALPRFLGLEEICVDAVGLYSELDSPRSPFVRFFEYGGQALVPEGARPIDSLLHGLEGTGLGLAALEAAGIHLSLIDKPFFDQVILSCPALNSLKLSFQTADFDVTLDDDDTKNIVEARKRTDTGVIASFLQKLPNVERISIGFTAESMDPACYAAALKNILVAGFKWPHLCHIHLQGVETDREELHDFFPSPPGDFEDGGALQLSTRQYVLDRTAPAVEDNAETRFFCVCGHVFGCIEEDHYYEDWDVSDFEKWWLEDPEQYWTKRPCLADKVADWFLNDGPYPLTRSIMLYDEED